MVKLNGKPLKLVDQFLFFGSNISSIKSDVNIRISKAWAVIDRLTTIWKSDFSHKIKWKFFQTVAVSVLLYGSTTLMKLQEKKLHGNPHKNAILNQPLK